MPLREYECLQCNYFVRLFDHSGKKPTPICVSCQKELTILISKSVFTLRGFGWAADGYSKDIDDAEEHWKKDGKPVLPHVKGESNFYNKKKEELERIIEKNLKKT